MPQARNGDVVIEYESFGAEGSPTVLLINGLGSQMTRWPDALCKLLTDKGLRVLRMDNRDVGKSSWLPGKTYRLEDMANDCMAVFDAAGVKRAHIAGVSMGGMIAQMVAVGHPDRTLSLTSIMSNTGNPTAPPAPAISVLTTPAPNPETDWEAFVAHGIKNARTIGSPKYRWTDEQIRTRVETEYRRAYNPTGVQRQLAAVMATGDRRAKLRKLNDPTVVLHGKDDPLVPVAGGEETAALIPGAELRVIDGMGHDLPPGLYTIFADAILRAIARADG